MSDLPSREAAIEMFEYESIDVPLLAHDLFLAYISGELQTEAECRATIEAGLDREFPRLEMSYPIKGLSLSAALDAALGVTNDD